MGTFRESAGAWLCGDDSIQACTLSDGVYQSRLLRTSCLLQACPVKLLMTWPCLASGLSGMHADLGCTEPYVCRLLQGCRHYIRLRSPSAGRPGVALQECICPKGTAQSSRALNCCGPLADCLVRHVDNFSSGQSRSAAVLQGTTPDGTAEQPSKHVLERWRIPSVLTALLVLTWVAYILLEGILSGFGSLLQER